MAALTVRVVISLAVVLGLFWLVARTGSRRLGVRDRGLLRVRGRQALTRGSSLAVVEVGARVLVVGVSDSGVRLLTELDPLELESTVPSPAEADVEADVVADVLADHVAGGAEHAPATSASGAARHRGSHRAPRHAGRRAARLAPRTGERAPRTTGRRIATKATKATDTTDALDTGALSGSLGGSLLAPATWRQAWAAATGRVGETAPGVPGDTA
ncbi:MAG: flagellar protein FliO/FliZ [Nocardioidaceae bacterium]|jgi:flagellar protein FliO/FliZ|nr:flagellar protein FliO/FliZ [Nocardioidaceae bacterium]